MKRKTGLVLLLFIGIVIFVLGFCMAFWGERGSPPYQSYTVKAGAKLELSWYIQYDERTEGGFTVSGGNEEARFTIKNPSGVVIHSAVVKSHYEGGFTASDTGMYSFTFENLDNVNDESIYVEFRSPYEPRGYGFFGLLMMLGGIGILFFGICALRNG